MTATFDDLLATAKCAAAELREAGIAFLLGGGLASWARGGPPTEHDVDFMLRPGDADQALEVLAAAGFRTEKPPEQWLYKAFRAGEAQDNDVMVDLIFEPVGNPIDTGYFDRAELIEVQAVAMLVMAPEDIMVTKLLALSEHYADYESVLEVGRALREQIPWDRVRTRTAESPFAAAFFTLAAGLGLMADEVAA